MRRHGLGLLLVLAVGASGTTSCNSKSLRSGYCNTSADCKGGLTCDSGDGGTFTCMAVDGGRDGSAGGGGVGGAAGTGGAGGAGGATDGGVGGSGGKPFTCDASMQCKDHDAAAPVCEVDAASCVECVKDTDCPDATEPICGADHKCRACTGSADCVGHAGTVCAAGLCVECATKTDCEAPKPACDTAANACVACVGNADCLGATPICNLQLQTCRTCASDSECPADPGVCMTDGHCATPTETIYVQNSTSGATVCSDTTPTAGTAGQPFCSMQPVLLALSSSRDLVIVRGTVSAGTGIFAGQGAPVTSIVGQQSAFIASAASPGFSMQAGSVSIRGVTFSSSASIGISATGGMLHLDTVTVDSCKGGGIFLDGAAFEIDNTTVTNNGPGTHGAITWGGILVSSLPAGGPRNLNLVTIQMNKQIGLTCSNPISGIGVFASANSGTIDVSSTCNVTPCSPLSAICGAPHQ
jgi:hypothetical protein